MNLFRCGGNLLKNTITTLYDNYTGSGDGFSYTLVKDCKILIICTYRWETTDTSYKSRHSLGNYFYVVFGAKKGTIFKVNNYNASETNGKLTVWSIE